MHSLSIITDRRKISVPFEGEPTVYELITAAGGIKADYVCGGRGTCRKCRVKLTSGRENALPLTESEAKYLSGDEIAQGFRYACMCRLRGDAEVEFTETGTMKIETGSNVKTDAGSRRFGKLTFTPETPTLDNPVSDEANLAAACGMEVPFRVVRGFTELLCAHGRDREYDIYTDGRNAVKAALSCPSGELYGIAADIGTTTLAVYLVALTEGAVKGVAAAENPQRGFGSDVISRINYTIENENGTAVMKKLILAEILRLAGSLCDKHDIRKSDVACFALAGNTVMEHLAAGLPPKSIAFAPFAASSLFDRDVTLGELLQGTGIECGYDYAAPVHFPLCFASYVGGDISCGILASDTDISSGLRLFLDIGTNGEIGLGNRASLTFCATAAGPAFEGAHIKQGLPGIEGAVSKVWLEGDKIAYEVIGGGRPSGICGSGIIDIAAVLVASGIVDETGRIIDPDEAEELGEKYRALGGSVGEDDDGNIFYIDKACNIYITQKDIREIQLAKAAVRAGIETLLYKENKKSSDITALILAGGFGAHINKSSACVIGMIPPELEDRIITAGNTAGAGAVRLLTDSGARGRIEGIRSISKYIELSGDRFFMDEYVDKMMF